MKFILGKKIGMSSVYDEKGKVIPVTVLEVAPNVVTQLKNQEKDGYTAVQIGAGKKRNVSKALAGHLKGLGNFSFLREFKATAVGDLPAGEAGKELAVGDTLDVSMFQPGDVVKVTGLSKGKGFQGAVKRHGFHGMPASHGHFAVPRHVGSIGQRFPQHTLKGMRMAGHMGYDTVTTRGLKVITVDAENQLLAVKGAVPGNRGGLVAIVSK